jgi:hypothetical protein
MVNIMKKALLLFISVVFLSCNSDKNNSTDNSNYKSEQVDFLKQNFNIPVDFKKVSVDEIIEIIKDSSNQDALADYELQRVRKMRRMGKYVEFFMDKNNFRNMIIFHPANYVKMTNEVLEVYMDLLENDVFLDYEEEGIYYNRIEGKFSDYGLAEIVKVRYLQKFDEIYDIDDKYYTNYLVSNHLKSFGILIINEDDKDFRFILDKYKL